MMTCYKPYISVIITVYNVDEYLLRRCIKSCLDQKYDNFELLLIDDGSTDGSYKICEEFLSLDKRIKLFHRENIGQYAEMNFGTAKALGKYVTFLDCDDYIENDYLCSIVDNIDDEPDVIVCGFSLLDDCEKKLSNANGYYGHISKNEAFKLLIEDKVIKSAPWAKLYKKEILLNTPYPADTMYGDIENTHKLFNSANSFVLINNNSYVHNIRKGSVSRTDSIDRKTKELKGWLSRLDFVKNEVPEYAELVEYQVIKKKLGLLSNNNYSKEDIVSNKNVLDAIKNDLADNKDINISNNYMKKYDILKYKILIAFSYNKIINIFLRIIKKCNKLIKIVK